MKKLMILIALILIVFVPAMYGQSNSNYGQGNQSRAKPVPEATDAKTKVGAISFVESDSTVHVGLGASTQQIATASDSIILGTVYTDSIGETFTLKRSD